MVPASHPCHVVICCDATPSVERLGMNIDPHKKCMTLFVLCCTRDFQTVWPTAWTLPVAWVTKICCDTCGIWLFFESTSAVLLILTISNFRTWLHFCEILCFWAGTQELLNWERFKCNKKEKCLYCMLLQWLYSWIFTRGSLTSSGHWFAPMSTVECLQSAVHQSVYWPI